MLFPRPNMPFNIDQNTLAVLSTTGHEELRLLAEFMFSGRSCTPLAGTARCSGIPGELPGARILRRRADREDAGLQQRITRATDPTARRSATAAEVQPAAVRFPASELLD